MSSLTLVSPGLDEIVVDFSRAEDEPLDIFRVLTGRTTVWEHPVELRPRRHLVEAGLALRVAKKTLWSHQDQWLPAKDAPGEPHLVKVGATTQKLWFTLGGDTRDPPRRVKGRLKFMVIPERKRHLPPEDVEVVSGC